MNIFVMILAAIFMIGFYMIGAPSQRIAEHERKNAIMQSDLRSIAECAATAHNSMIKGTEFIDICIEQNQIDSRTICLNNNFSVVDCQTTNNRRPAFSYMVTATAPINSEYYNQMMEILEKVYPDAGTFGILTGNKIVSGGTSSKRIVPKGIMSEMELTDGQLVYLTQFDITTKETEYALPDGADIICPAGTIKSYRFGRWQCIAYNTKTNCGGDMIWDSYQLECVPDESRRPLCTAPQTAVIVDSVWECISPFADINCPSDMTARLNYSTLEWECVAKPGIAKKETKCSPLTGNIATGGAGAALRLAALTCTDCEKMITNMETCDAYCVPDTTKLSDPHCYAGSHNECTGLNRAFSFGFPSRGYAARVPEIKGYLPTFQQTNRRFNCVQCDNGIDTEKSLPPYIVVCK